MTDDRATLTAILQRLDALDRLEAGQSKLAGRMDKIEGRMDQLEEGQNRLRVDVMDRIDRLQEQFTQVRDESLVTYSFIAKIDQRQQNTHEEHRLTMDIVNTMMGMLRRHAGRLDAIEDKHH
jgi:uncharacterized protein YoxC